MSVGGRWKARHGCGRKEKKEERRVRREKTRVKRSAQEEG